jgi:hypothetical protein
MLAVRACKRFSIKRQPFSAGEMSTTFLYEIQILAANMRRQAIGMRSHFYNDMGEIKHCHLTVRTDSLPKMRTLLLIILVLLLIGAFPAWPYSTGWGYYPSGGLGLILVIVLILILMGAI